MTRIVWGYDPVNAHNPASRMEVVTDFDEVVNPHMAICGDSGTGKTHTLRHAIREVLTNSNEKIRFHIFDVHGDIEFDDTDCSTVIFSENSPYGFNPLKVNSDPHAGGVRKAIQGFINNILSLSPSHGRALGPKQQDILRNLMMDIFYFAGFDPADPKTWVTESAAAPSDLVTGRIYLDIPFEEKDIAKVKAKDCGISLSFDGKHKAWHVDEHRDAMLRWPVKVWGRKNPTLNDLCMYAARRREMSFTGLGQREAEKLGAVHSRAKAMLRAMTKTARSRNNNGDDSQEAVAEKEQLEKVKQDFLESLEDYVRSIETGRAMETLLKYDSYESLSTVRQILESLNNCGVFRDLPPNFDPKKRIWRYHIKHLREEEQIFLVNVRLHEIFEQAVMRGDSHGVIRDVIVIDEGAKFVSKESDHIINKIALEARKFGLGIWFASQSPTHYPEQLLSSMATKVILGLDANYWNKAQALLRIDEADMKWIRPREGLLVHLKLKGESAQGWRKLISVDRVKPRSL